jgi:aspartate aminotransferase
MHIIDQVSSGAIVVIRDRLMELQAQGKPVFRLESGDPNFSVESTVAEAMNDALRRGHTHYTQSAGIPQLRKAVANKLNTENQIAASPDDVIITSGGMHALYLTFCSMLNPGDEVIIPDPMWTEIAENIKLAGGVPVRVPLNLESTDDVYPVSAISAAVTPKTKAIFINTPHNPTGAVLNYMNLSGVLQVARDRDLMIISDEAYEHLMFDGVPHLSIASFPDASDRVISIFSTSKSYAMSGLRVGYIVSRDRSFRTRVTKLLRCTTNGVNSIAQHGAVAALQSKPTYVKLMREEYQLRCSILLGALKSTKYLSPIIPRGGFFLWVRLTDEWCKDRATPDWDMTNYLIDKFGIGSAPGSAFSSPDNESASRYIRLSFSGETQMVRQAASLLEEV